MSWNATTHPYSYWRPLLWHQKPLDHLKGEYTELWRTPPRRADQGIWGRWTWAIPWSTYPVDEPRLWLVGYLGGGDGRRFLPTAEGEASKKAVPATLHLERIVNPGQGMQCRWYPLGNGWWRLKKNGGEERASTYIHVSVGMMKWVVIIAVKGGQVWGYQCVNPRDLYDITFLMNSKVCWNYLTGIVWKWNYVGMTTASFPDWKSCPVTLLNGRESIPKYLYILLMWRMKSN